MNLAEGVELLRSYSNGSSTAPFLEFIDSLDIDTNEVREKLGEVGSSVKYTDSFLGVLSLFHLFTRERKSISALYDRAIQTYDLLTKATATQKPTSDQSKLKKMLTDYILKVEKLFEAQDLSDESLILELSRFINEVNQPSMDETEIRQLRINSRVTPLIEPHLDKHREVYFIYLKLQDSLKRLVRIGDMIMEETGSLS